MNLSKEQKRLFSKNAKFLKRKVPQLSMYIDTKLPANVDLYDKDGEVDILINGSRFYGIDAKKYADHQINAYLTNPSIVEGFPPEADKERTPTHLMLLKKLDKAFQRKGYIALKERLRIDSATTFVFGVGLGHHLYPLVAHTRCRDLVIVESEPLFINLSMYFVDWVEIYKTLKDRVAIIVTQNPDSAFTLIRSHIHHKNPGVLQAMFHFSHYKSEYMDAIYKRYQEKSHIFFDGLGFYDDEKIMTRNSLMNIYLDSWRFCGDKKKSIGASAIIVGAGPSLNKDIDWIKSNQNNIIIFSGGSALQSLLTNGIVPDFHVEIENISLNYELLKPLVDNYDLSKTILICSSTMDPASARLFQRRIWFMREGVMASSLLAPDLPMLSWQNPAVVNTAAAASVCLGFRNIFLLGADFGTANLGQHHSSGTSYETHDELRKIEFKFPEKTKGNFGGIVHTNAHMLNGLGTLKLLLSENRSVIAYNGSGGAKIDKTIPIRSDRYKIIDLGGNKTNVVEAVYAAARQIDWSKEGDSDLLSNIKKQFSEYIDIVRKVFSAESRKNKDFILYNSAIHNALNYIPEPYNRFNPMITGSITTQTLLMMYWWRRIPEKDLPGFEYMCRRQWQVFLNVIEKDFKKFIESVRQEMPLVRPELFDDKGNLIVKAEVGRVSC